MADVSLTTRNKVWDRIIRLAFELEFHDDELATLKQLNRTRLSLSQVCRDFKVTTLFPKR